MVADNISGFAKVEASGKVLGAGEGSAGVIGLGARARCSEGGRVCEGAAAEKFCVGPVIEGVVGFGVDCSEVPTTRGVID